MSTEIASDFYRAGRLDEAEGACRTILAGDADNAAALSLLGLLLNRRGRTDEGVRLLRRAVELRPDEPQFLRDLAYILGLCGRHDEAAGLLERSLQLGPAQPHALYSLGVARERGGQIAAAERSYREAVALAPDYADAHNGLGNALRRMGRNDEAVEYHRAAIRLRPDSADAYAGLARGVGELGRQSEATACLRKVVELRPGSARDDSDLLYDLHYDVAISPEELFEEHRRWAQRHAEPLSRQVAPHPNRPDPSRGLRVGYVSADFRAHPVARFQEAVLAHHDHSAFEVFCYSGVAKSDAVTQRLRGYADHWRDVRILSDEQLAEAIRGDRIDVLVDLAGHAAGNRLLTFARCPAPVQVTCNGYMNTTGMKAMGYRFTDALHDPPGMTEHLHTEQLIRLPGCNWCYRPDGNEPEVSPPPCLSNGFVTFGSLNKLNKVTPMIAGLWAEVLKRVAGSRLVLVVNGGDRANPSARQMLVSRGIPDERLELLDKAPSRREYLERYRRMDIALDTFPFNGITTTCDALWMGVPVVSLCGRTHASRAGLSILSGVGLPKLACADGVSYVNCAIQLAADPARRSSTRQNLRKLMESSPLRSERQYACAVEVAFRAVWTQWCEAARRTSH